MARHHKNIRAGLGISGAVVETFRRISQEPTIRDRSNHYELIEHTIEIGPDYCRRTILRRGKRVATGIGATLQFDVGTAHPIGNSDAAKWSAKDVTTGNPLRVEIEGRFSPHRKVGHIFFATPIRQGDGFEIETRVELCSSEIDGFGCAGVKLRGFSRGIDLVRVYLSFETAPAEIAAYRLSAGSPRLSRIEINRSKGERETRFSLSRPRPTEQQILVSWFRGSPSLASKVRHEEPAVRLLIIAANPPDTQPLDLELEIKTIRNELGAARFRDAISVTTEVAVTPSDFVKYVRDYRPNVIHFCGHGSQLGIGLRSADDRVIDVGARTLSEVLAGRGVELVVLNSCYSRNHANEILRSVPTVVGTHGTLPDDVAIQFAKAFYRSLGDGSSVKDAFRDGRDAVLMSGHEANLHLDGESCVTVCKPSSTQRR